MGCVKCHIGCAGWSLPKELRDSTLSYLERYAQLFNCVEINSSFYRHHQAKTYARWASCVPDNFRFSVKVPKKITHEAEDIAVTAARFLDEIKELGNKLGPLLMQFPPKRAFDAASAERIFSIFREKFRGEIVCEPRHPAWFQAAASEFLQARAISLVGAHPQSIVGAPEIFDDASIRYFRLHGAPRIYYSDYSLDFLDRFKKLPALRSRDTWVIFDNTALGCAPRNALALARSDASY